MPKHYGASRRNQLFAQRRRRFMVAIYNPHACGQRWGVSGTLSGRHENDQAPPPVQLVTRLRRGPAYRYWCLHTYVPRSFERGIQRKVEEISSGTRVQLTLTPPLHSMCFCFFVGVLARAIEKKRPEPTRRVFFSLSARHASLYEVIQPFTAHRPRGAGVSNTNTK